MSNILKPQRSPNIYGMETVAIMFDDDPWIDTRMAIVREAIVELMVRCEADLDEALDDAEEMIGLIREKFLLRVNVKKEVVGYGRRLQIH